MCTGLHFNFHSGKKDAVTHTKAPQYPESHAIMKVYSLGTLEKEEDRRCSSYFVSQTGIKILLEVLGFYEKTSDYWVRYDHAKEKRYLEFGFEINSIKELVKMY